MDSVIQFRGTIYENGYGLLAQQVMRDKSLPKQSKLIYAYMCSFASINTENGERTAFPSVSLQCDELGMGEDTYYKWRKPLEEQGFITIEKRKVKGRFDRNIYYIESVPQPKKEESEPYPKNSGTVNPSKEKQGTIINSSNSNNFNNKSNNNYESNIDDDKRTSPSGEDSALHNEEDINLTISNMREVIKDEMSDRSYKAVVKKVVDKYNQGKVTSFRDYLVTALANKIEELERRRIKDNAKRDLYQSKKEQTVTKLMEVDCQRKVVPFYNWLEE